LRALPSIHVRSPRRKGLLELASPPRISFTSDAPAAYFRVTIELLVPGILGIPVTWTARAADLPREDGGGYVFVAAGTGLVIAKGGAPVDWITISDRLAPHVRGRRWSLPAGIRVEAAEAPDLAPIARSEWIPVGIVPNLPRVD
jgi:hypothetical protein